MNDKVLDFLISRRFKIFNYATGNIGVIAGYFYLKDIAPLSILFPYACGGGLLMGHLLTDIAMLRADRALAKDKFCWESDKLGKKISLLCAGKPHVVVSGTCAGMIMQTVHQANDDDYTKSTIVALRATADALELRLKEPAHG